MAENKRQKVGRPRGPEQGAYQVRALQRGLAILSSFGADDPHLTMAELSERLELPKPTVHRLLEALRHERFVSYDADSGTYSLGLGAMELGIAYQANASMPERAIPFLRELTLQTGHTSNLGILDQNEIVHVAVEEPDRPLRYHTQVGAREQFHSTGLGKVLVAHLDTEELTQVERMSELSKRTSTTITDWEALKAELEKIRAQGYAEDREESAVGLRCLAAPIRSADGRVVAAMSISGPAADFENGAESLLASLLTESQSLSESIGWTD